jgi:hypothetical protein
MLSTCDDTLNATPLNVTPIVLPLNASITHQSNHRVCAVNETYIVTPNTSLEPPSQANAKLAGHSPYLEYRSKKHFILFSFRSRRITYSSTGFIHQARLVHGFLTMKSAVRLRKKLSTPRYF